MGRGSRAVLVRGKLKVENAYTWPIDRCTARAAGGTKKRLKPAGAMVTSRSRNDDIGFPTSIAVINYKANMPLFRLTCHRGPI